MQISCRLLGVVWARSMMNLQSLWTAWSHCRACHPQQWCHCVMILGHAPDKTCGTGSVCRSVMVGVKQQVLLSRTSASLCMLSWALGGPLEAPDVHDLS